VFIAGVNDTKDKRLTGVVVTGDKLLPVNKPCPEFIDFMTLNNCQYH
jgi:hypothetical protein